MRTKSEIGTPQVSMASLSGANTPKPQLMLGLWEELGKIICCPDDEGQVEFYGSKYSCRTCSRQFPILPGKIADLRPRSPQALPSDTNSRFVEDYAKTFHRPLDRSSQAVAWGATEVVAAEWARKRERQVRHIGSVLKEEHDSALNTFCDFSAGAGYYTLEYARSFPLVLHCDLSADSLVYASQKAEKLGIENIAFLRIDYLQPPFPGKLDCAICMDSLERGEGHERMLLEAIQRSLRLGGIGVVDFHNWWHNPLRRLGLLAQNFGLNRSYTRREVEALLRSCGIREFSYAPFFQEFEANGVACRMARAVLPATRHVFSFKRTNECRT
jgi:SAM-dependent methyltransferase